MIILSFYISFCMDFVYSIIIGDSRCVECYRKGGEEVVWIGRFYIYICYVGIIDFVVLILISGK